MPSHPISVAFCSDMKYVAHLATAMQSLFEHSTKDMLDIYIISTDLDVKSKEKLKSMSDNFSQRISFLDIKYKEYAHLEAFGYFSLAIYLRLSLPDFFTFIPSGFLHVYPFGISSRLSLRDFITFIPSEFLQV